MATPIVRAVYGYAFINPTTVDAGGVQLLGVDPAQPIQIVALPEVEMERHGLERDAVRSVALLTPAPAFVAIPAMGSDVETLKLLFAANTSDGIAVRSDDDGTQVVKGAHASRTTALAIRPNIGAIEHWYFPQLTIANDAIASMEVHRSIKELANSNLILTATRAANSAAPAVGRDVAATLNALYSLP